jgi:Sigma-70, region 4
VLGGWLYNTTRHLAMHAVRTEQRRREREQTAFAMQSLNLPTDDLEIAVHLEPAMAELDADDRDALVLRYLANRGLRDVGAELGISEDAARKRVNHALERLRMVLEHRSIPVSTVLLATALTSSIIAVPAGLGAVITATALAPVTAATLTKATLITMKWLNAKTVVATIAAAAVSVGTGTYLIQKSKAVPPPSDPGDVVPIKFANDSFAVWKNDQFLNEIDPGTKRTPDSASAGHIKSLVTPTSNGSADYVKSLNGTGSGLAASRLIHYDITKISSLFGKRIRITGWLKTSDVRNWAGIAVLVSNAKGQILACDEMTDRPIHGTTPIGSRSKSSPTFPANPVSLTSRPSFTAPATSGRTTFRLMLFPPTRTSPTTEYGMSGAPTPTTTP